MNSVTLKDILNLLVVWIKSRFTKEGRKAVRRAVLHNKVHGVTNSHEIDIELLKPQLNIKKATTWPAEIDDLYTLGIMAVEMSNGCRWEYRAAKGSSGYKWVSATHKKTSEPKATVTPASKTQRVMNPHTGEFEDIAI